MRQEQKRLVQDSFAQIAPIAEEAGQLFYARLFERDPTLRVLFRGDIREQSRHLMTALRFAVESLNRLEELLPALRQLGQRHVGYGVTPEHFALVGETLLWTLEQGLGDAFTPETREAWAEVYAVVATVMQEGMEAFSAGTRETRQLVAA